MLDFVRATVDFLPEKPNPGEGCQWRAFELSELKIIQSAVDDGVGDEEQQYGQSNHGRSQGA